MPTLPTAQRWRVVAITYELGPGCDSVPVIRHEFYGATREQAIHVSRRHLQTDTFLAGCEVGRFGQVICHTAWYGPEEVA